MIVINIINGKKDEQSIVINVISECDKCRYNDRYITSDDAHVRKREHPCGTMKPN